MIYLFTALYGEAQMFIERFHLKKQMDGTRFQQFRSESGQILLTVSGVGEIAAAAAVSSVCTQVPPGRHDFLLNVGICAGVPDGHGIYYIRKLTELTTGKTFYPDLLYIHGLPEAELWTVMKPWRRAAQTDGMAEAYSHDTGAESGLKLYDMEAAAIYQAGAYFFSPHQMIFVKVISDSGEGETLGTADARNCLQAYGKELCELLERLLRIVQMENRPEQAVQYGETEQLFQRLCADLHCSKAMADLLRQYVRYASLSGIDYCQVVQKLYEDNRLPCGNKREGKQCFEELKQRLF